MEFQGLDELLERALQEDIGSGDLTTEAILADAGEADLQGVGELVAKQSCVLAGWPVFVRTFRLLGTVEEECRCEEGSTIGPGEMVGTIAGPVSVLLRGERTALNLLQRMSGIATETRRYAKRVRTTGTRVVDTRKTTPLWRNLEKYAVRVGGGGNHRMGLHDGFLIKENHIAAAGGLGAAIQACRKRQNHLQKIEVEVTSLAELDEALEVGVEAILLDNMDPGAIREAVDRARGRCVLEVSGGITAGNILEFAQTGVDLISVGAITHSAPSVDLSLTVKMA